MGLEPTTFCMATEPTRIHWRGFCITVFGSTEPVEGVVNGRSGTRALADRPTRVNCWAEPADGCRPPTQTALGTAGTVRSRLSQPLLLHLPGAQVRQVVAPLSWLGNR